MRNGMHFFGSRIYVCAVFNPINLWGFVVHNMLSLSLWCYFLLAPSLPPSPISFPLSLPLSFLFFLPLLSLPPTYLSPVPYARSWKKSAIFRRSCSTNPNARAVNRGWVDCSTPVLPAQTVSTESARDAAFSLRILLHPLSAPCAPERGMYTHVIIIYHKMHGTTLLRNGQNMQLQRVLCNFVA